MKKFQFYCFAIALLLTSKTYAQFPDFSKVWGASGLTNGSIINPNTIITDSDGYVYIGGSFQNKVAFGQDTLVPGYIDIFIVKYTPQGDFVWVKQFGGTSFDTITSLVIDRQNNIYAAGVFRNTVYFDSIMLKTVDEMQDGFVMKLDTEGNVQWAQQTHIEPNPSSISNSAVYQQLVISIDRQDNLIFTCPFWGIITFQGHRFTSPDYNVFFTKLDSNGNIIWIKQLGGVVNTSTSIDANNNIFLIGYFSFAGPLNFDGTQIVCTGSTDTYISKFSSGGALKWVKAITGIAWQEGNASVCDKKGNVYVAGELYGTTNFDNQILYDRGSGDAYLTKLDSLGNYQWLKQIGGDRRDYFTAMDIDTAGNILVTGNFSGTGCLIENETIHSYHYSMEDIFTVKYKSNGQLLGIQQAGGIGDEYSADIHITKDNIMYLTGRGSSNSYFGSLTIQSGSNHLMMYVAKVLPQPCQSVLNLSSPANDYTNALQFKVATQQISATNQINGNSDVLYQAGKNITLMPGFSINAGSVFKTRIAGCE